MIEFKTYKNRGVPVVEISFKNPREKTTPYGKFMQAQAERLERDIRAFHAAECAKMAAETQMSQLTGATGAEIPELADDATDEEKAAHEEAVAAQAEASKAAAALKAETEKVAEARESGKTVSLDSLKEAQAKAAESLEKTGGLQITVKQPRPEEEDPSDVPAQPVTGKVDDDDSNDSNDDDSNDDDSNDDDSNDPLDGIEFASAPAEKLAIEEGLVAADFEGATASGEEGDFTKPDVQAVVDSKGGE